MALEGCAHINSLALRMKRAWTKFKMPIHGSAAQQSLSLILCARHTMTHRSMYAKQEESAGRVAGHPH